MKPHKLFNADERILLWKTILYLTFLSKEEEIALDFKLAKECFTLNFRSNSSSNFMTKPLLILKSLYSHFLKVNGETSHLFTVVFESLVLEVFNLSGVVKFFIKDLRIISCINKTYRWRFKLVCRISSHFCTLSITILSLFAFYCTYEIFQNISQAPNMNQFKIWANTYLFTST